MTVSIAVMATIAENGVTFAQSRAPWRLKSDMRRFKAITMGKPVIMGRKTFESIRKALPGRPNFVVSRQERFHPSGVRVAPSLDAALVLAEDAARTAGDEEIMVIGGGELYRAAIALADRLYITHVEATPEGDTVFPTIDPAVWRATSAERLPRSEADSAATTFVIYERIDPSR